MPLLEIQKKIRNIAVIAHVDHGNTTLIDGFLKQTNMFRENEDEMKETQILDSNELEREKGITILAKNISIHYNGYKINVIDTPGHSDFGGEVERTLNMADGALLVIDAQEGPMPQTEFVLKKALELKLKIIVIINKIDKKFANIDRAKSRLEDLFLKLAVDEAQLEYPIYYAIGRKGKIWQEIPAPLEDLKDEQFVNQLPGNVAPILDAIIEHIPAPSEEIEKPLQMQIVSLDFNSYLGRYIIGRINRGKIVKGQKVVVCKKEEKDPNVEEMQLNDDKEKPIEIIERGFVEKLFTKEGLEYKETDEAIAGDIVAISGVDVTAIGATV